MHQPDTKFPPAAPPFVCRLQFKATLRDHGEALRAVEVIVDYDELGRSSPHGYIIGNNETTEAIKNLEYGEGKQDGFLLESDNLGVTAKIDLRQLVKRGPGTGPTGVVGEFTCRELTITQTSPVLDKTEAPLRELVFLLAGPETHWHAGYAREVSYTGEAKIEGPDWRICLEMPLPFTIEARPHFLYSTSNEGFQLVESVVSLRMLTEKSQAELSDDLMVDIATSVVEDLCLLVSFLSSARSTWYQYSLSSLWRVHCREFAMPHQTREGRSESPLQCNEERRFLRNAVPRLRQLRQEGTDPKLAILHTVAAAESGSPEVSFINLFFALESLRYTFARGTGRTSLWQGLQKLLAAYNVEWRDLYPQDLNLDRPRFIRIRNDLVHTGKAKTVKSLFLETVRLRAVVERLLLSILGWEGFAHATGVWSVVLTKTLGDEDAT